MEIIEILIDFFNEDFQSKPTISNIQRILEFSRIMDIDLIGFELLGSNSIQHLIVQGNQIKMQVDRIIIFQIMERQVGQVAKNFSDFQMFKITFHMGW